MAEIDELFDSFTCIICYREYSQEVLPLIVCLNCHFLCNDCFEDIKSNASSISVKYFDEEDDQIFTCPICKEIKYDSTITDFPKMLRIRQAANKIKERENRYQKEIEAAKTENKELIKQIEIMKKEKITLQGMIKFKDLEMRKMQSILERASNRKQIIIPFNIIQATKQIKTSPFTRMTEEMLQLKREKISLIEKNEKLLNDLDTSREFIKSIAIKLLYLQDVQDCKLVAWKEKPLDFKQIQQITHQFQQTFSVLKKTGSFFAKDVRSKEESEYQSRQKTSRQFSQDNKKNEKASRYFQDCQNTPEKSKKGKPKNYLAKYQNAVKAVSGTQYKEQLLKIYQKKYGSKTTTKKNTARQMMND